MFSTTGEKSDQHDGEHDAEHIPHEHQKSKPVGQTPIRHDAGKASDIAQSGTRQENVKQNVHDDFLKGLFLILSE